MVSCPMVHLMVNLQLAVVSVSCEPKAHQLREGKS